VLDRCAPVRIRSARTGSDHSLIAPSSAG